MGVLRVLLTWWNGHTLGTWLHTRLHGQCVGEDEAGNRYFRNRDGSRRWVVFCGESEASRVPPEWRSWLHRTTELSPAEASSRRHSWQRPHEANQTGLPGAWRPRGSLHGEGKRPPAVGDYQPWTPPEKEASQ